MALTEHNLYSQVEEGIIKITLTFRACLFYVTHTHCSLHGVLLLILLQQFHYCLRCSSNRTMLRCVSNCYLLFNGGLKWVYIFEHIRYILSAGEHSANTGNLLQNKQIKVTLKMYVLFGPRRQELQSQSKMYSCFCTTKHLHYRSKIHS